MLAVISSKSTVAPADASRSSPSRFSTRTPGSTSRPYASSSICWIPSSLKNLTVGRIYLSPQEFIQGYWFQEGHQPSRSRHQMKCIAVSNLVLPMQSQVETAGSHLSSGVSLPMKEACRGCNRPGSFLVRVTRRRFDNSCCLTYRLSLFHLFHVRLTKLNRFLFPRAQPQIQELNEY